MSELDYRTLLMKYINHVGDEEGVTFLSDTYRRSGFTRHRDPLTEEEWDELQRLDEEAERRVLDSPK